MATIYICESCGAEVVFHTDIKTKAPKKCWKCKGKEFKLKE